MQHSDSHHPAQPSECSSQTHITLHSLLNTAVRLTSPCTLPVSTAVRSPCTLPVNTAVRSPYKLPVSTAVRSPYKLPVSTESRGGQITVQTTSQHRMTWRSDGKCVRMEVGHIVQRRIFCRSINPRVGPGRQGDLWPRDCSHRQVMTVMSGVQPLSVPCLTALWSPPSHRPLPWQVRVTSSSPAYHLANVSHSNLPPG